MITLDILTNWCDIYKVARVAHRNWSDNHCKSFRYMAIHTTTTAVLLLLENTQLPSPPRTCAHKTCTLSVSLCCLKKLGKQNHNWLITDFVSGICWYLPVKYQKLLVNANPALGNVTKSAATMRDWNLVPLASVVLVAITLDKFMSGPINQSLLSCSPFLLVLARNCQCQLVNWSFVKMKHKIKNKYH